MKVQIERTAFLKALSHSQSVVEKRATVPILSHVLLEAEGDTLRLTATDLEIALVESIPAAVLTPGKTTVSAHMLHDIVRKLRDGAEISLKLSDDGTQLVLVSGRSEFVLSCLPADEFPAIQQLDLPHTFMISTQNLGTLLEKTRFAMSTEETRYALNGVYLHPYDATELRAVATDGHRLARLSIPLPEGAGMFPGVILSRKTVNEVLKVLAESTDDIRIALSDTQVSFQTPTLFLTSRLIDGTFPEYEQVIPANNDKSFQIDMGLLAEAVDRVATISAERNRGVTISIENNKLVLSTNNAEIGGSAVEEVEIAYDDVPVELGFNARYLMDVAQQMPQTQVDVLFADASLPVIVQDVANKNALYLLMPMRA